MEIAFLALCNIIIWMHSHLAFLALQVGGSSTVRPVAEIWGGIYQTKCHEHSISVQGGGSSRGARRVCNVNSGDSNPAYQSPVDIGVSRHAKGLASDRRYESDYLLFSSHLSRFVILSPGHVP